MRRFRAALSAVALVAAALVVTALAWPATSAHGGPSAGGPLSASSLPASSLPASSLPASSLRVRAGGDGRWRTWWRSPEAPARWPAADPVVAGAVRWRAVRPGLELGELAIAGTGEAARLRVVVVRLDPRAFEFALETRLRGARHGAWSVDSAPPDAALAFNAGQFLTGRPWGWVMSDGAERHVPGVGPLAMAVAMDDRAAVYLVPDARLRAFRAARRPRTAFQSYPMLLADDGTVPAPVRAAGRGLDVAHRDGRFAIGRLRDGRLLLALTRFAGLDGALPGALDELPLGLTVPESAALMGALGCAEAVLLDGGISAQLLVRDERGGTAAWRGWRKVPMGVVVRARANPAP